MRDITTVLDASDEQLLSAAGAAAVNFSGKIVAPSIVLGEPCDI